jgi:elongation factor Ts
MMSMELVKKLRDRSGAPIMDCKKALENADVQGNMDKALDWLRKKGMSVAQSKANRVAAEGLVAVHVDGLKCVIVEVHHVYSSRPSCW